ncbi:MAG: nitrous oxide reductase accessory protein NosL [Nitrososphaerota archaeon]|nr:nitrous oxide reductase accessory protein NosL [Candidatus Calditenuis fumarioli]
MRLGRREFLATIGSAAVLIASFLFFRRTTEWNQEELIREGEDRCDYCEMPIRDRRFAGAMLADGRTLRFDDIYCLLVFYLVGTGRIRGSGKLIGLRFSEVEKVVVHDLTTGRPVSAEGAWFVMGSSVRTPMGSGIVAFREISAASEHAISSGGQLLSWEALVEKYASLLRGGETQRYVQTHEGMHEPVYLDRPLRLVGGGTVTLRELLSRGRPVLVIFFATWCPTCSTNVRNAAKAYEPYRGKVTVVAKSFDPSDSDDDVLDFKRRMNLPDDWIYVTANIQFLNDLKVVSQETLLGFDPDGRVVYERRWGVFSPSELAAALEAVARSSGGG